MVFYPIASLPFHGRPDDTPPARMSKCKAVFSAITSHVARKQLMASTPCWERGLAMPEDVTRGQRGNCTGRNQARYPPVLRRARFQS